MNKILCFDVSNRFCSVAVAMGQEIISFKQELCPSMQAEKLMGLIEESLQEATIEYQDLSHIAVTIGPGSFTGIRIGLAAAKGIIHATGAKSLGITNFQTSFYKLKQQVKEFDTAVICINAYRNQQYVQIFNNKGEAQDAQLVDNISVSNIIKNLPGRVICAGSGIKDLYNSICEIDNLQILPRFSNVRAIHIARYADELINNNILQSVEPLYIRPPDAIPPKIDS